MIMDVSDNVVRIVAIVIAGGIETALILMHQDGAYLVPTLMFIGMLFPGVDLSQIFKRG